jgi:hypothetical protein
VTIKGIANSETPPKVVPVHATPTGLDSSDECQLPPGQGQGVPEETPATIGSTSTTTNTTLADA